MHTGNIIRNFHFVGHGWDFDLSIRAADEQAYQEAKTFIRTNAIPAKTEQARQEFLARLREAKGTDV